MCCGYFLFLFFTAFSISSTGKLNFWSLKLELFRKLSSGWRFYENSSLNFACIQEIPTFFLHLLCATFVYLDGRCDWNSASFLSIWTFFHASESVYIYSPTPLRVITRHFPAFYWLLYSSVVFSEITQVHSQFTHMKIYIWQENAICIYEPFLVVCHFRFSSGF